jgi:NAD-dependent deacetylase
MKKRGSIFVLTGAGISAESGIPVFQGTSWRGHSHYELANVEAWERDPQLVWEYYSDRRARARDAKPNAAHIALAEWENDLAGRLFLCTQNVDGLHEAAGSQDVVHIHGKLFESRCAADCGRPLLPTVAITLKASCRAVFAEPWCVRMSAGLASSRIILVALMTRCKGVKYLSLSGRPAQCSRWPAL